MKQVLDTCLCLSELRVQLRLDQIDAYYDVIGLFGAGARCDICELWLVK